MSIDKFVIQLNSLLTQEKYKEAVDVVNTQYNEYEGEKDQGTLFILLAFTKYKIYLADTTLISRIELTEMFEDLVEGVFSWNDDLKAEFPWSYISALSKLYLDSDNIKIKELYKKSKKINYINPKDDLGGYISFAMDCIEYFEKHKLFDDVIDVCSNSLNLQIDLNSQIYIYERKAWAYYSIGKYQLSMITADKGLQLTSSLYPEYSQSLLQCKSLCLYEKSKINKSKGNINISEKENGNNITSLMNSDKEFLVSNEKINIEDELLNIDKIKSQEDTISNKYCVALLKTAIEVCSDTCYNSFIPEITRRLVDVIEWYRKYFDIDSNEYLTVMICLQRYIVNARANNSNIEPNYKFLAESIILSLEKDLPKVYNNRNEYLTLLSSVYSLLNKPTKAIKFAKLRLKEAKKSKNQDTIINSSLDLLALSTDITRQNELHDVINYLLDIINFEPKNKKELLESILLNLPTSMNFEIWENFIKAYAKEKSPLKNIYYTCFKLAQAKRFDVLNCIEQNLLNYTDEKSKHSFYKDMSFQIHCNHDTALATIYLQKAIDFADSIGHREWNYSDIDFVNGYMVHDYSFLGDWLESSSLYNEANKAFKKGCTCMKQDLNNPSFPLNKDSLYYAYARALQVFSTYVSYNSHDSKLSLDLLKQAWDAWNKTSLSKVYSSDAFQLRYSMIGELRELYRYNDALSLCDTLIADFINKDTVSDVYNQKALIYSDINKPFLAIENEKKAISLTSDDRKLNFSFNRNLASFYKDAGDYSKTQSILEKLLSIVNEPYVTELDRFLLYDDLAHAYVYSNPEKTFQFFDLAENCKIPKGFQNRIILHYQGKAIVFKQLGRYYDRKICLDKAIYLCDSLNINNPKIYGVLLRDLADYYNDVRNYTMAYETYTKAIDFMEQSEVDTMDPSYESALNNLACFCSEIGEYQTSISINERLLDQRWFKYGGNSELYQTSLFNLCQDYITSGRIQSADSLCNIVCKLNINKRDNYLLYFCKARISLNKKDFKTADSLFNIAAIYAKTEARKERLFSFQLMSYETHKKDKLYDLFVQYIKMKEKNLISSFLWMSESERKNFDNEICSLQNDAIKYIPIDSRFINLGLNLSLLRKCLLMHSSNEINKKATKTKEAQSILQKIHELRDKRNNSIAIGDSANATKYMLDIESLERYVSYNFISADYIVKKLNVTYSNTATLLKDNEIAIQFICNNECMGAFLFSKRMEPVYVELDKNIQKEIEDNNLNIYNDSRLFDMIWRPLYPYLKNYDIVWFSPDGILNRTAIELLFDQENHLLNEYFKVHRTFHLSEITHNHSKISSILAVGGVNYNENGNDEESNNRGSNKWRYLPGTRKEIDTISSIMKGKLVEILCDTNATETKLKSYNQSNINLLHIATHGFYIPDTYKESLYSKNPLIKNYCHSGIQTISGLVLSGANKAIKEYLPMKKVNDDEILTSEEVELMSFPNLSLVVLSSCESGLGESNSEGVWGMQRAFKSAGAESLLVSIDEIDDQLTMSFMTEFYTQLSFGTSVYDSFWTAQKKLRRINNKNINYDLLPLLILIE